MQYVSNRRLIIIAISIAVFMLVIAAVAFAIFFLAPQPKQGSTITSTQSQSVNSSLTDQQASPSSQYPTRSTAEMSKTISTSQTYLVDQNTGQPAFSVIDSTSPQDGWYIVTIRLDASSQDLKVILHEDNGLKVVLGPASIFPSFTTGNLPTKVQQAVSP